VIVAVYHWFPTCEHNGWLEPEGDSLVGGFKYTTAPQIESLWYGPERGWEPVKEKK
jgi:hypothetical protein